MLIVANLIFVYSIAFAFSGPLATNVITNVGCEGVFFAVTALAEDIRITSFDTVLVGTADVRVYYRVGSYSGSENTSSGWTLLGSQTMTGGSGFIQTLYPLDVGDIIVPAGQTYGFLIYSGFAGTGTLAIRTRLATVRVNDSYIDIESSGCSIGGSWSTPVDGVSTAHAWRGVVDYETVPPGEIADGRINRSDLAAPFAVYPHVDENGASGLVIYDTHTANSLLLAVTAEHIAAVGSAPVTNTLIAESVDGRVALDRLTGGSFYVTGLMQNGKTYVLIFPALGSNVEYTSFEE